ncbi:type II secretion system protein [Fusobacterium polymorphum]|uniref:type II secretion system protein n=1 Tax=Fusobacterium nucleatum subsp. polymorphum TaxID=76857 RepID=UPI00300B6889
MYINKNKALSFIEIIVAVTILLAVSFASLITFYSMNKSFLVMNSTYKREKEIMTFRDLVTSHIKWNESLEIRVTNISKSNPINSLGDLFLKPSEKEGNLLVLKIKNYDETEKKVEKYYRCFLFYEDKVSLSYFDDSNIHSLVNIFTGTVILENCTGKFLVDNNILKVYLKDKDKEYEEILYYEQK